MISKSFVFQTDKAVYMVTEKAIPLEAYLKELKSNEANFTSEHLLEIAWGLQQLCVSEDDLFSGDISFAFSAC